MLSKDYSRSSSINSEQALSNKKRLKELDEVIRRSLADITLGFYTLGIAFRTIKQEKLYEATHTNFKIFCESKREQYRLSFQMIECYINAAIVVDKLKANGVDILPNSEALCRPLSTLKSDEDIVNVWTRALEATNDAPTRPVINKIVSSVKKENIHYTYTLGDIVVITDLPPKNYLWAIITKIDGEWIDIEDYESTERIKIIEKQARPLHVKPEERAFYIELKNRLRNIASNNPDDFSRSIIKKLARDPKGYLTEIEEKTLKILEESNG